MEHLGERELTGHKGVKNKVKIMSGRHHTRQTRNNTKATQKSQILDHFWYLLEPRGPPWGGSGPKRRPSGFQRTLWEDLGRILVLYWGHLATLLDNKLPKRLFRDALGKVQGEVSKETTKCVEFLTLSNPLD